MPDTLQTAAHVALLAPVPLVHLEDGRRVVESEGKVAFGSRPWETFRQLDELRKGQTVDVYIYASHSDGNHDFEVSWRGRYIGQVEGNMGSHPDGMRYRPPSTCKNSSDNSGYWAVFWELDQLAPLSEAERIHVSELTGYGKNRSYGHAFPPEGPLLIEHP